MLIELGVDKNLTRFARTRAAWRNDNSLMPEDLFVTLAGNCWSEKRLGGSENLVAELIADQISGEVWSIYMILDDLLQKISEKANERLMWQTQFSVQSESNKVSPKRPDTVVLFVRGYVFSIITLFQSLLEEFYYVSNTFDYRARA